MKIAHAVSLIVVTPFAWLVDWSWSLPLVVLTVVLHVFGLLLINRKVEHLENKVVERYSYPIVFVVIIGATALLATILHGIEGKSGPPLIGLSAPCQTTAPQFSIR